MNLIGVVFRVLNIVLMVGIPCLAALILFRKGEGGFRPIWIGALIFILSQVGHIPFNQFLLFPWLRSLGVDLASQAGNSILVLALAAGLSAGLFEEFARYLAFRYWLKRETDSLLPVKYAVGHGGIEAILAGLLALVALVQVVALGSSGSLEVLPADKVELIRSQLEAYWAVPVSQTLLGAGERVSAMLFHLGASLLVYKSVREKKPAWLLIAVLGHAGLDAFAVSAAPSFNVFLLEGLIFIIGAGWAAWGWLVRVRDLPEEPGRLAGPPQIGLSVPQVTSEQLDESRYE